MDTESKGKYRLYIETYGCQMNTNDSEVVLSIMQAHHYTQTTNMEEADLILINTCSIRENAETRIKGRLQVFRQLRNTKPALIIGLIGCMAERLKEQLFADHGVNLIVGPDAYRQLPRLIDKARNNQDAINVQLSLEENYEDIIPTRTDSNGVSAFISITRGCNNFCSYCVVPYTRGRERSRPMPSILNEARELIQRGYKEITLLGQNVNSYTWKDSFQTQIIQFPELITAVAELSPQVRIRFATSHPKDLSNALIDTIAAHPNICSSIHLPVQSGSSSVLQRMKRKYSREDYLDRVHAIRSKLPDCTISTDIISGFCDETEDEHAETLSLMKEVHFSQAFMFKYSNRAGTWAALHLEDNVPETTKTERLNSIIALQQALSKESNKLEVNSIQEVLVEGESKKSKQSLFGRTSRNKVVVFPRKQYKPGDYVQVRITDYTSATLLGDPVSD